MRKKLIFLGLVLVAASFFWVSSESWISNPVFSFANPGPWLVPIGSLTVLAAILGIIFMVFDVFVWKVAASAVSVLPFVVVFGFHDPLYFAAAFVLVVMHLDAIDRIKKEVKNRLRIDARLSVRRGVNMIVLPHLLLISFAYYQSPAIRNAGSDAKLPKSIERAIEEAVDLVIGPKLEDLPPAQRAVVEREIYPATLREITSMIGPYFRFLPPLLAFGLFLALQGLSPLFFFAASIIALLIFQVMKMLKAVEITTQDIKAEVLKF